MLTELRRWWGWLFLFEEETTTYAFYLFIKNYYNIKKQIQRLLGSSPYPPPTAPSLGPMPLRSAAGAWACRPLPHGVSRTPGPCSVFYGRGLRNRRRGWWVSSVASRELGVHGEVLKRGMCGMIWWFGAKGSRLDVKEYSVSLKLMKTSRIQITLEVILKVCILTSYR